MAKRNYGYDDVDQPPSDKKAKGEKAKDKKQVTPPPKIKKTAPPVRDEEYDDNPD